MPEPAPYQSNVFLQASHRSLQQFYSERVVWLWVTRVFKGFWMLAHGSPSSGDLLLLPLTPGPSGPLTSKEVIAGSRRSKRPVGKLEISPSAS